MARTVLTLVTVLALVLGGCGYDPLTTIGLAEGSFGEVTVVATGEVVDVRMTLAEPGMRRITFVPGTIHLQEQDRWDLGQLDPVAALTVDAPVEVLVDAGWDVTEGTYVLGIAQPLGTAADDELGIAEIAWPADTDEAVSTQAGAVVIADAMALRPAESPAAVVVELVEDGRRTADATNTGTGRGDAGLLGEVVAELRIHVDETELR